MTTRGQQDVDMTETANNHGKENKNEEEICHEDKGSKIARVSETGSHKGKGVKKAPRAMETGRGKEDHEVH